MCRWNIDEIKGILRRMKVFSETLITPMCVMTPMGFMATITPMGVMALITPIGVMALITPMGFMATITPTVPPPLEKSRF